MAAPAVISDSLIGLYQPFTPNATAGPIINSIRDQIPDPVYNNAGDPQPDSDGSFLRVQSLYRWLSNALLEMSRRCNWLVPDWTAFPSINTAQSYTLDAKWVLAEDVWFRQLRCAYLDEAWTIYPSAYVGQSLSFSMHRRAGALDLSLYGAPNLTDTTTTLSADMTATQDSVVCTATTDFLSFGWVLVGGELMEYRNLNTDTHTVYTLRRGAGGTRAEVHYASDPVTHCSLWVKGLRSPNPVTRSTDPLEVPIAFIAPLELYVLSKVREAEQDRQEAKSLMDSFIEACKDIAGDPVWQAPDGTYQVRAYGSGHGGGIYPLGPFGTVVG